MKVLHEGTAPRKNYDSDAAYDLKASLGEQVIKVYPNSRKLIPTSLHVAIPQGYAGLVMPRSGLAVKFGVTVLNAPGLIDPHYTGDVSVLLINHGDDTFVVRDGDRIAQLMIVKIESVEWQQVDRLDDSDRGDKGFGSSGV